MMVTAPSRLHISLLDLNASIGRIDGGIGIALEKPRFKIKASKCIGIYVESKFYNGSNEIRKRVEEAAKKVLGALGIEQGIDIYVEEAYPQHIGLGSGTQLALAVGRAVCELYGKNLSTREIAKLVERGGTSGIGVAAFERGGFILDGGHSTKEKRAFLPSSASKAPPPPVLARYDFPDWKLALVFPREKQEFFGRKEVKIFQKHCPIALREVQRLSHIVLMQVLPSLVEQDIETFGRAINAIQGTGFKKIEVSLQNSKTKALLKLCQKHSYGAGLSSFGPTIYCVVRDEKELQEALAGKGEILITKADNHGATIER